MVLISIATLTACGRDEVTKEQFLDHAVEFSTAAKTDEQRADVRKIFECVWPEISEDEKLLGEFMDAETSDPELSARVSRLMVPCVSGGTAESPG